MLVSYRHVSHYNSLNEQKVHSRNAIHMSFTLLSLQIFFGTLILVSHSNISLVMVCKSPFRDSNVKP